MRLVAWLLVLSSAVVLGCNGGSGASPSGNDAGGDDSGSLGPDGGTQNGAGGPDAAGQDAGGDGADPSVVLVETAGIGDMQIDSTSLYWVSGGTRVMRMPLSGAAASTLVSAPQMADAGIGNIAVDSTHVYWDEAQQFFGSPGAVYAAPLDGGSATKLADVPSPGSLSLDGNALYVNTLPGNDTTGEIDRIPITGGPASPVVRGVNGQSTIVAVDGYVYLVVDQAGFLQNVFRVPGDASAGPADAAAQEGGGGDASSEAGPLLPVSTNGRVSTLILAHHPDGHDVYWAVFDEVHGFPGDAGKQVDLGTVSDPLDPQTGGSIDALYPSGGAVFWYSQGFGGPTGDLWEFPAGGDPRDHLAYTTGGSFVANATDVYFADGLRIRRVKR